MVTQRTFRQSFWHGFTGMTIALEREDEHPEFSYSVATFGILCAIGVMFLSLAACGLVAARGHIFLAALLLIPAVFVTLAPALKHRLKRMR